MTGLGISVIYASAAHGEDTKTVRFTKASVFRFNNAGD